VHARPPPLITFSLNSKVAVYAPAEWADTLTLFHLYENMYSVPLKYAVKSTLRQKPFVFFCQPVIAVLLTLGKTFPARLEEKVGKKKKERETDKKMPVNKRGQILWLLWPDCIAKS
jgi:hypothetical protein